MYERSQENREMLRPYVLKPHHWRKLGNHAWEQHLDFIVTPFDVRSLSEIESTWLSAVKIAHSDLHNRELLVQVSKTNHPVIISIPHYEDGEYWLPEFPGGLTLLYCHADYPANPDKVDWDGINRLRSVPGCRSVGFSDHCDNVLTGARAVEAGALVLEKHFTLDRKRAGADHFFSMNPVQFKEYIRRARNQYGIQRTQTR